MLKDEDIRRWETKTHKGHTISVFFNAETNLFVADLVHKNGEGGFEFCRLILDEKTWLSHCKKNGKERGQRRNEPKKL